MNETNKDNGIQIWNKYQTIWLELYQEYAYAFKNYNEYSLMIKSFLNKINKKYSNNNLTKELYLNEVKKYIRNIIRNSFKNNQIDILLKYINLNINPNNKENKEIDKLVKWFKSFSYVPEPNVIIDLIEQSIVFKELIKKLVDNNFDKIKQHGVEKIFDNDLIILFVEIYCTLNNIDLENEKSNIENIKFVEDDNELLNDILGEQKNIISTYEEENLAKSPNNFNEKTNHEDYMPMGADAFISEIKRKDLKVLTKEEEKNLMLKIKNGDKEAYQYFYEHNFRLVISIAKKYRNCRVDYEDLLQEGCLGLMVAIEHFEINRNLKFSTYATWWIRQYVTRAINKYGRTVGISISKSESLSKYRKKIDKYADELGRKPTDEEIAKYLEMSLKEVEENNQLLLTNISMNQKINEDDTEFGDFISDDNIQIEDNFIIKNLASELQLLFKKAGLTEKEIEILTYSYGLNNQEEKTLTVIGKMYGFSRERARQCVAKAIKKLRTFSGTKDFSIYLDNPDKARENLKTLMRWHYSHPSSHIIYDIDLNKAKSESESKTINVPKKKEVNELYKIFKQYDKRDIDAIVATLSKEEKEMIYIRNKYLNNPTLYSPWNKKIVKNAYDNIIKKIQMGLNEACIKGKKSTIYDLSFSKNYSKEEVQLAIYMLDPQDQEIVNLRYGKNLENPVISESWNFKKYGDIFYEVVIPHIINNLNLIRKQNKEIEEKIINLYADDKLDNVIKEIYIKALKLFKLIEFRKITKSFSFKEKEILAILSIKYFENIEINIADFAILLNISKEELEEYLKKILIFLKQNKKIFINLKNNLYFTDDADTLKR